MLSTDDVVHFTSLTNAGVAPKEIRTYIRQNTTSIATQQDVYNRIADARREMCEGQSTINALANQLDREGFWSRVQLDPDNRVKAILFAHPESLAYLQAYPDTIILDCTYKTNKYKMPLLDIIGVDASQRSFCIAFAFLSGESQEDFVWALERLKSLFEISHSRFPSVILTDRCLACMNAVATCFPSATSLLCLWHANKAVLRYCQPAFTRQQLQDQQQNIEAWKLFYHDWHQIIKSSTEEIFNNRLFEFRQKYTATHIEEVAYVKTTWLDLYKEKLVKAWVDQHPHFGNVVTFRVEGIHALLKSYLKKSTLDLFEAWKAIKQALLNQLAELRSNQAKQHIRAPIELSGPLYSVVRGWVSHEALRKVEEQRKLLTKSSRLLISRCTGSFSRSQGLPCVHKLEALLTQDQVLQLEDFHSHWHLIRRGTMPFLVEPRQRFDPIAATSSLPQSSIRRELSGFEMVETSEGPNAPPICSKCHALGHTKVSRVCPLRHTELRSHVVTRSEQSQIVPEAISDLSILASPDVSLSPTPVIRIPSSPSAPTMSPLTEAESAPTPTPEPDLESEVEQAPSQPIKYDDPKAIYQRYVEAKDTWYKAQPPGTYVNNKIYRKAMHLPVLYNRTSYDWCLDLKQMGSQCTTSAGSRDWTREEMMAYLDWDRFENDRMDVLVARESRNGLSNRRGVGELWRRAAQDQEEQQALHSST
ncbi:transposase-like protein [Apiospora arundinis]